MIHYIKVTRNPDTIIIFKEGNIVPLSAIKDRDVIKCVINITIIHPINTEGIRQGSTSIQSRSLYSEVSWVQRLWRKLLVPRIGLFWIPLSLARMWFFFFLKSPNMILLKFSILGTKWQLWSLFSQHTETIFWKSWWSYQ